MNNKVEGKYVVLEMTGALLKLKVTDRDEGSVPRVLYRMSRNACVLKTFMRMRHVRRNKHRMYRRQGYGSPIAS